ncbi:MAG: ATP-binding domain-containing protein [Betaproteobacteria bacterium]|nr:ATP-binding domain-containing protein [Betaproteobacteria bacterium]
MARIVPHGWKTLEAAGPAQRRIETLRRLDEGLPDDYTVYHGVHWTRLENGHSLYGEIDFAVVSPSGRVLLIEQKTGFLSETPAGLVKALPAGPVQIAARLARSADALQGRFAAAWKGEALAVETLLFCPDYVVRQPAAAGIEPSRIVDASRRAQFARAIQEALPLDEAVSPVAVKVHRFLRDLLELTPEIGAIAEQVDGLYTRLSGGLTHWARALEFSPFRLRVTGTAGSGKTQLALAVIRDAAAAGRRALYVCYNRPLADHMSRLVPDGAEVATYHQLCERTARRHGISPDFASPGVFARLENAFAAVGPGQAEQFDELIVDEGQDFDPAWRDPLLRWVRAEGRAWWLEDPQQNLYDRPAVELPGWVRLRADTNYRSPRDILQWLRERACLDPAVTEGCPLSDSPVQVVRYDRADELEDATKRAITLAVGLGFKRSMIGVVTYRGRENSRLAAVTQLGPHRLRAATGRYDLLGNPEYSDGEVLIDSVYRFKGRAAPCVVFTEIDFGELDERVLRKLFVGATRASMKLIMVMSARAARLLSSDTSVADGR